jgi:hypothetical protein
MKNLKNIALALVLAISAFGQSEKLNPTQLTSSAIGRNRPLAESIGASIEAPVPYAALAELDAAILKDNLSKTDIEQRLGILATLYPGHNYANATVRTADGRVKSSTTNHNLRTNAGANWQADIMANTSTPAVNAQCNWIALTNDSTAPAASGTTLTAEIAANGLTRAQGTYAHTSNATSYTLAKTFTASGTQAFQQSAIFTASSSGTMCFWATVTAGTVNNTDTLTMTWTVNF